MEPRDISAEEREFLKYIKIRPQMYFGEFSIQKAFSFFTGYRCALYNLKLADSHCILPQEFHAYVAMKYGESPSKGWCGIILEQEPEENKALWLFFDLLDEFLVHNGFEPIEETPNALVNRLRNCINSEEVFGRLDIEKTLEKRRQAAFQAEWNRVNSEIEARKTAENYSGELQQNNHYYQKLIYDDVYKLCANEELAGEIANDFGMIYAGCAVGYHDKWYDWLVAVYKQYTIEI